MQMRFIGAGWLVLSACFLSAATHTWTGISSGLWSDSLNWIGGAPQSGETAPVQVLIPTFAPGFRELTNDIPGLTVNELVVAAHANTLHALPGLVLRFQNGVIDGLGVSTIFSPSFLMELDGVTHLQGGGDFVVRGAITESAPGASLHVTGHVRLEASMDHSGPTFLHGGTVAILGSVTNTAFLDVAPPTQLTLASDFTVLTNRGWVRVLPESHQRPQTSRLFGHGFVCAPGSTTSVAMIDYPALDSEDPSDGGRLHSRLVVNGPVVLAGRLEAETDLFQDGLRFGIVENVGSFPTVGRFEALPEGALMRVVAHAGLLTQRINYRGGNGRDVTATFVLPPTGRRLAGPFLLENGWLQIVAGLDEFESMRPHRWEATEHLAESDGWTALGPDFLPAEAGTLLTITNAAAFAERFFRLAVP